MWSPAIQVEVNDIMSIDFTKRAKTIQWEKNSTSGTGTTGHPRVKSKRGSLPHTIQKNQLKIDQKQ